MKKLNLMGQKFGRLTVIAPAPSRNGNTYWLCRCECGEEKEIQRGSLQTGATQSCGCLQKQLATKNITGQIFGNLVAVKMTSERTKDGLVLWKCKCLLCGDFKKIASSSLIRNHTQSCGCMISRGEQKLKEVLSNMNINFIQQKTFKDLYSNKNGILKFDFYFELDSKQYCLEYQGFQHYQPVDHFGGKDSFQQQKQNDKIKQEYCKSNNIILIEIPYWDYDILTKEYIEKII